jgi:hypothetical protein
MAKDLCKSRLLFAQPLIAASLTIVTNKGKSIKNTFSSNFSKSAGKSEDEGLPKVEKSGLKKR